MNIFFVSGGPGSGKTSWCTGYVDWLRQQKYSVGGILSPEVRRGDRRIGFDVIDLVTGERAIFARLWDGGRLNGVRAGKYVISEVAVDYISRSGDRRWITVDFSSRKNSVRFVRGSEKWK